MDTAKGRTAAAAIASAAVALTIGACGSSKPAYCSEKATLQDQVKGLPALVRSRNVSDLRAQVTKIKAQATTVVDAAKSDFPDQTNAIRSSVDALQGTVTALSANPSAQDVAQAALQAATVVSDVSSFTNAANDKCD